MFHKILIANRGEIAVRIIRACRNMGIRSVAVYSKEDQNSLHVQLADQRVCIGEGPARNNYLNMERIITAARNVGADAIHPGFGFLSELPIKMIYFLSVLNISKELSLSCTSDLK